MAGPRSKQHSDDARMSVNREREENNDEEVSLFTHITAPSRETLTNLPLTHSQSMRNNLLDIAFADLGSHRRNDITTRDNVASKTERDPTITFRNSKDVKASKRAVKNDPEKAKVKNLWKSKPQSSHGTTYFSYANTIVAYTAPADDDVELLSMPAHRRTPRSTLPAVDIPSAPIPAKAIPVFRSVQTPVPRIKSPAPSPNPPPVRRPTHQRTVSITSVIVNPALSPKFISPRKLISPRSSEGSLTPPIAVDAPKPSLLFLELGILNWRQTEQFLESLAARQKASALLDAAAAGLTWPTTPVSFIDTDLLLSDIQERFGEKTPAMKCEEVVIVQETKAESKKEPKAEPKKATKKVVRVDPLADLARSRWA